MPILTPDELYAALGINPGDLDEADMAKYEFAIEAAESAVEDVIGAVELATGTSTPRDFEYDPSGLVDIDACVEIVDVSWVDAAGQTTSVPITDYDEFPLNGPVYTWIELCGYGYGGSPAMGFMSNADVRAREGRYCYRSRVRVTADWGYAAIPASIKQAVIWTALAVYENPRPYISESIEGYSRTIGFASPVAIPERAQKLLYPYLRYQI